MTVRSMCVLQRSLVALLLASAIDLLPAPAFAERTAPNSVTARVFAGPQEANLGLGYSRDFEVPLRVSVAGGWFAAGDGSANWQALALDARLVEGSPDTFVYVAPALFVGVGVWRFLDAQSPDGHDTERETIAGTLGITAEMRPPQNSSSGLVLSLGGYAAFALAQSTKNAPPYKVWDRYTLTPLAMLSVGYGF